MIQCVIIDDEPLARSVIKEYLKKYPQIDCIEECNDGFEGIKAISQHKPDLLFLDIQMPKINGFEMLELIDRPGPEVIFTTAYDEYAIQAFEASALDYLLKPFSFERFEKAVNKFLENNANRKTTDFAEITSSSFTPDEQQRIVVKTGSDIRIIGLESLFYIEAYDDYVKIHTKDAYYLKKKTMTYYEQTLDASLFVRVHRSYILALTQLTRIETIEKDSHVAVLKNGKKIPLSKSGYTKLKQTLGV